MATAVNIDTHPVMDLPLSDLPSPNLAKLQFPDVVKMAVAQQKAEIEAYKRGMASLEIGGSIVLLFALCFQPLLDCYRSGVYKEDKRVVMLGSTWFCMSYVILLVLVQEIGPKKMPPLNSLMVEILSSGFSFLLMGCLLASVQDSSSINTAEIVVTYLMPYVVVSVKIYYIVIARGPFALIQEVIGGVVGGLFGFILENSGLQNVSDRTRNECQ